LNNRQGLQLFDLSRESNEVSYRGGGFLNPIFEFGVKPGGPASINGHR
jgi:hypothetical protein